MRSTLQTVPESLPADHITNQINTAVATTATTETTTTKPSHSHTNTSLKGRTTSTKVYFDINYFSSHFLILRFLVWNFGIVFEIRIYLIIGTSSIHKRSLACGSSARFKSKSFNIILKIKTDIERYFIHFSWIIKNLFFLFETSASWDDYHRDSNECVCFVPKFPIVFYT